MLNIPNTINYKYMYNNHRPTKKWTASRKRGTESNFLEGDKA